MPFLKLWNLLNFIVSSALGDPKVKSSPDNKIRLFFFFRGDLPFKKKRNLNLQEWKELRARELPSSTNSSFNNNQTKKPQSQFILKLASLKPWAFHSKKEFSKASLNLTFLCALNESTKGIFFEKDFQNRFFFPYSFLEE